MSNTIVYYDPERGQFYTTPINNLNSMLTGNTYLPTQAALRRTYLGDPSTGQTPQATIDMNYTPNAANNAQLSAFGNGISAPQWMHDAYAAKIASMGGNANPPVPYQINQSGYPGVGGKVAPVQGGE
jgi:hypothetical protein